jgi:hypothetical protein
MRAAAVGLETLLQKVHSNLDSVFDLLLPVDHILRAGNIVAATVTRDDLAIGHESLLVLQQVDSDLERIFKGEDILQDPVGATMDR